MRCYGEIPAVINVFAGGKVFAEATIAVADVLRNPDGSYAGPNTPSRPAFARRPMA
jgi:hypothetical protein